jgi:hypothetical protein
MTYSYFPDYGSVIRDSDQKLITPCQSTADQDFLDYKAWVDAGNSPAPPPPASELGAAKETIISAVQAHMDYTASLRGYDSILSLCTYANSSIPQFKAEGQAGVNWRDQCWAIGYGIMADVLQGRRAMPTAEQVLAEMPSIVW